MANLDFGSIYKELEFDYIHSNAKNFNSSVESQGDSFSLILKSIKNEAVKTIQRDIKNFRKIENIIAQDQLKKFKDANIEIPKEFSTPDRHGLRNYMEYLKNKLENEGVSSLSSIIKFKTNLISIKKIGTSFLETRERITKKLFGDKTEYKDLNKKQQKEVQKLEKDITEEINKLAVDLAKYLESIILYILNILDPHVQNTEKTSNKKITAAKQLLSTFSQMGINLKNVSIEDIENIITSMGVPQFLSTFLDDSKAKTFFGGILTKLQTNSNLGEFYEGALVDSLIVTTADIAGKKALSVFDKGDIKEVGDISAIKDNVTMDLQFVRKDTNFGNIVFGASLKLRSAKKIGTTMSEKRWQEGFKSFLGERNFKKFTYFRKNTIVLQSFKNDKDTKIKTSLVQLQNFEKEIVELIGLVRLLFGFYNFLNNQYQTSGSTAKEFYYTAYIFGLEGVLSSADALEALLNSIIKDNQTFTKKLEEKKGKKVVQFEIKNVDISKQKLKDFWKIKKSAIRKLSNNKKEINYRNIMSDQDVLQELLFINENLGNFSYEGGLAIETTTPQIKKLIEQFNKNV